MRTPFGDLPGGGGAEVQDRSGTEPKRPGRPRPQSLVTFARVDRPLVASGLFRMWPPNARGDEQAALEAVLLNRTPTRAKRNTGTNPDECEDLSSLQIETIGYASRVEYQHRLLLLSSAYTLGPEELLVLLAACGMAGMLHHNGARYEEQRKKSSRRLPQRAMAVSLLALPDGEQVFRVQTSLRALVAECGFANTGPCRTRVLVSLLRLSGVTCVELGAADAGVPSSKRRVPAFQSGPRLLTVRVGQPPEHKVQLELSVRLTKAALQRTAREGVAVRVDLQEARAVSDGARILLVRFSERVAHGSEGTPVQVDEMVEMIYGPQVPAHERTRAEAAAVSTRRTRAKLAAAKIAQLPGWAAAEQPTAPGAVVFRRLAADQAEARRTALINNRPPPIPSVLRTKVRRAPRRRLSVGPEVP